jgi:hypothetical protein
MAGAAPLEAGKDTEKEEKKQKRGRSSDSSSSSSSSEDEKRKGRTKAGGLYYRLKIFVQGPTLFHQ